jgi:hypothetical protein
MARPLLLAFALLPGSIPFLYSGAEYGTQVPTNLEFGSFDLKRALPPGGLLLFNHRPVERDEARLRAFVSFWRDVLTVRRALGTAALPPAAVHAVRRDGPVVSFGLAAHRVVVNLGQRPRQLQWEDSPVSGAVGSRAFALGARGLTIPPLATVVVAGEDTSMPFDSLGVLHFARGHAAEEVESP